jgi:hypothetical protein
MRKWVILFFQFSLFCSVEVFPQPDEILIHKNIPEIVIINEFPFRNEKEQVLYNKMESEIRAVYPILKIIRSEYKRINRELQFYEGKRRDEFLKWYEKQAQKKYLHLITRLTIPQGRMLLLLIDRELDQTPFEVIKSYRNGFRAMVWQGVAFMFLSNLKTDYNPEENPMIEHIMKKIELENKNFRRTNRGIQK